MSKQIKSLLGISVVVSLLIAISVGWHQVNGDLSSQETSARHPQEVAPDRSTKPGKSSKTPRGHPYGSESSQLSKNDTSPRLSEEAEIRKAVGAYEAVLKKMEFANSEELWKKQGKSAYSTLFRVGPSEDNQDMVELDGEGAKIATQLPENLRRIFLSRAQDLESDYLVKSGYEKIIFIRVPYDSKDDMGTFRHLIKEDEWLNAEDGLRQGDLSGGIMGSGVFEGYKQADPNWRYSEFLSVDEEALSEGSN